MIEIGKHRDLVLDSVLLCNLSNLYRNKIIFEVVMILEKVLHLLNFPGDGGSEKYVNDIIHNYGIENCVFASSLEGPLKTKFEGEGVKCYSLPMKHPFDINAALHLKKMVEDENVSLVHTHFLRENYIAILAKILGAKIDVIWTYHVNVPMSLPIRMCNRIITLYNKKVIAVSNFMKRQLISKGVSKQKVVVVNNGIDLKSDVVFKDQLDRGDKVVFATIGRLSEEKGHLFLLDGLKELLKDPSMVRINWKCKIIGDGKLKDTLMDKVKALGLEERVEFCGYLSNVTKELEEIDVVIIPSKNDAFPYVALESLAMGKVIIGTNVGGIPEIVSNEETGLIIEYGNNYELSNALERVVNDKDFANKLSQTARASYLDKFTFKKMFDKIISIYNS